MAPACHADATRNAGANPVSHTFVEADVLDTAPSRALEGCKASREEGRWDSTRRLMDL